MRLRAKVSITFIRNGISNNHDTLLTLEGEDVGIFDGELLGLVEGLCLKDIMI